MKRELFKSAWQLVKTLGISISEALKKSWKAYKLKLNLQKGKVRFKFKKKSGEIREAYGTLKSDLINYEFKGSTKENFSTIAYWDLDSKGFRSFKLENLV